MEPHPRHTESTEVRSRGSNKMFYGGAFWFCCIVFTADMIIPTGVAMGLGYILPVAVGLLAPSNRYLKIVTPVCTLLIVLGHLVSPMDGAAWVAITNRGLSILTLWVVAGLCLKLRADPRWASRLP